MFILNQHNSIANHYLSELRDVSVQSDRFRFRHNLKRLGFLLGYELSKNLNYKSNLIDSPLGEVDVNLVSEKVVVITIMRAGLPFQEGFLEAFDKADAGFIGAWREEREDIQVALNYVATDDLNEKTVILVDPMLATGKSLVRAVDKLLENGKPSSLHIAATIASPEGVEYLKSHLSIDYDLWLCALDEKLNDKSYIVPGLGDAGDLSFGPKI